MLQKSQELLIWKRLAQKNFLFKYSWVTKSSNLLFLPKGSMVRRMQGGGVCVCVSWIHSKQCVVVLRYRNYQAVLLREMSPTDGPLYAVGHSFWPVQGDLALLCNFVKQRPFWLISPWNFELEDRMFSSKLDYVFINILGSHYELYGWTRVVTLGALLLRFCHM